MDSFRKISISTFFIHTLITDMPLSSDPLADFKRERQKYKIMRKEQGTKGVNREEITLAILDKFKTKLESARTLAGDYDDAEEEKQVEEDEEEDDSSDMSWYVTDITVKFLNFRLPKTLL